METTVKALVISTNGTYEVEQIPVTLRDMQRAVGGLLEGVALADGCFLYCDEEGKLKGRPVNHLATALAWTMGFRRDDEIVGDVIVVGIGPGDREADVPAIAVETCKSLSVSDGVQPLR